MLEGLDAVDWGALEHAYGPAADVPGQIRALRSLDPKVRDDAYWQLYGNIFHQGTRYQASAAAVPFLLELLADPATPERAKLVELLASLAVGYDEQWLPRTFPVATYRAEAVGGEELLRAAPPLAGEDDERGMGRRWEYFESLGEDADRIQCFIELAVYDAVRAGVPVLGPLVADGGPPLRIAAAYALGWFPEEAAASLPALRQAVTADEPAVAATALVSIGLIGAEDEQRLAEPMLADPRAPVRWAAAVALANLRGPAAGARVAAELLTWSGGSSESWPEIPFRDGDLAGYAGLALTQLGEAQGEAAFDALLTRLPEVSGIEALTVVGVALDRAFPDGPIPDGTPSEALDGRQRRLVEVLAGAPASWRLEGLPFGNLMALLGSYGLPGTPEAMRAYLAGS